MSQNYESLDKALGKYIRIVERVGERFMIYGYVITEYMEKTEWFNLEEFTTHLAKENGFSENFTAYIVKDYKLERYMGTEVEYEQFYNNPELVARRKKLDEDYLKSRIVRRE